MHKQQCKLMATLKVLDKDDCRLQGYYQEAGRAGRDSKPSECVIYYAPRDCPRIILMLRKGSGGRASKGSFQKGMALLTEVMTLFLSIMSWIRQFLGGAAWTCQHEQQHWLIVPYLRPRFCSILLPVSSINAQALSSRAFPGHWSSARVSASCLEASNTYKRCSCQPAIDTDQGEQRGESI